MKYPLVLERLFEICFIDWESDTFFFIYENNCDVYMETITTHTYYLPEHQRSDVESYQCLYCPNAVFLTSAGYLKHGKEKHLPHLEEIEADAEAVETYWKLTNELNCPENVGNMVGEEDEELEEEEYYAIDEDGNVLVLQSSMDEELEEMESDSISQRPSNSQDYGNSINRMPYTMNPPLGLRFTTKHTSGSRNIDSVGNSIENSGESSRRGTSTVISQTVLFKTSCPFCKMEMVKPSLLVRHIYRVHNVINFESIVESKGMPDMELRVDNGRVSFFCCGSFFDSRFTFMEHRKSVHAICVAE